MSTSIGKVFLPLTSTHVDVLSESCSLLLKSAFQLPLHPEKPGEVTMGLTNNFLLLSYVCQLVNQDALWK